MLVSGETIAVIGYSYERGGTEVGLSRSIRRAISRTNQPIICAQTTTTHLATMPAVLSAASLFFILHSTCRPKPKTRSVNFPRSVNGKRMLRKATFAG